ncbi:gas vesicle protein [Oceanobacillus jordanicus]|uniref:Gas vesicle protein n=1 Tax=Oceanobacillus jordanicus TaxID=2867266 RepID=A0AAW5AY35_9BACI|nr:gas vesicle protein [Oceanobacillus jordanicus]MCG3417985.1 gas vesicle protein [Oceanobacillus jordanicus]
MPVEQQLQQGNGPSNLVDVLEKVLDKGVVIAGDISVGIADVELLTIKIRLIVSSVDKAKEIGMDWWETDPYLSSKATEKTTALEQENKQLHERLNALEDKLSKNESTTQTTGGENNDQG